MTASDPRAARIGPSGPGGRIPLLVLTTTFPGRPGDGTPEFVLTLARSLSERFDITIVAPRIPGSPLRETVDGIRVRRFRYFLQRWEGLAVGGIMPNLRAQPWRALEVPFLVWGLWWAAWSEARRRKPAVVHAHWILPGGLVGLGLKRLRKIPYVLTVHGTDAFAFRRALGWLRREIVHGAATPSAVSRDLATLAGIPAGGFERTIVPLGADSAGIRAAVGTRSPQKGQFLVVARLAANKGVDGFLRALAGVRDARAVIVGDGPEEQSLRRLAGSLGLRERVRFAGRLTQGEVFAEFRSACALVIPSRPDAAGHISAGVTIMSEAMAAGVPVIASAIGGLPEHVRGGETGLLVPPDSVEAMTAALRQALESPGALEECGRRGQEHAFRSLNSAVAAERYAEFFARAAAGAS